MNRIPDADYIREAEQEGMPSPEPVCCPCCGEECTTIYANSYGEVFACNWCLMEQDADEWAEEKRQAEKDDFMEHNRMEE